MPGAALIGVALIQSVVLGGELLALRARRESCSLAIHYAAIGLAISPIRLAEPSCSVVGSPLQGIINHPGRVPSAAATPS